MMLNSKIPMGLFLATFLGTTMLAFQNCSKTRMSFDHSGDSLLSSTNADFALSDTVFTTDFNTPVQKQINFTGLIKNYKLSFDSKSLLTSLNLPEGKLTIVDPANFIVRFEPAFGFRGHVSHDIFAQDKYTHVTNGQMKILVGSALSDFKPALAIRGTGCISCHANVSSTFVTDHGYKGGGGKDYFLGTTQPDQGFYSFHDNAGGLRSIQMGIDAKFILPSAAIPSTTPINKFFKTTEAFFRYEQLPNNDPGKTQALNDYKAARAAPPGNDPPIVQSLFEVYKRLLTMASSKLTQTTEVVEVKSVYIGAPTADEIRAGFGVSETETFKFIKESNDSPELKGLTNKNGYFKISSPLVCDGDLFLNAPLLLENVNLLTTTGCRIYNTASIFVYGTVNYISKGAASNLQLMSARSINLGLGSVFENGNYCEVNGWHKGDGNGSSRNHENDSLLVRYLDFSASYKDFTRSGPDINAANSKIIEEYKTVRTGEGKLLDAACRPEGRDVSFDSILLNAPKIHSRYFGNVHGVIIAETGLFSLGKFAYQYDEVFNKVSIFPFVSHNKILDIQN